MNNTPYYKDTLYYEKKMDCKNCPYTDEYCASGDCERDNNLTEQWHDKNLDIWIYYYVEYTECDEQYIAPAKLHQNNLFYFAGNENGYGLEEIDKVLAPVPSYEELNEILESEEKSHLQADSYYNKILELKELLKECSPYISRSATSRMMKNSAGYKKDMKLLTKIDEVLK